MGKVLGAVLIGLLFMIFPADASANVAYPSVAEQDVHVGDSHSQELSAWPRIRDRLLGRDRHRHRPPPPPPPVRYRPAPVAPVPPDYYYQRELARRDQMRWEAERRERERLEWERRDFERRVYEEQMRREWEKKRRHEREAEIMGEIFTEIIKNNRR